MSASDAITNSFTVGLRSLASRPIATSSFSTRACQASASLPSALRHTPRCLYDSHDRMYGTFSPDAVRSPGSPISTGAPLTHRTPVTTVFFFFLMPSVHPETASHVLQMSHAAINCAFDEKSPTQSSTNATCLI